MGKGEALVVLICMLMLVLGFGLGRLAQRDLECTEILTGRLRVVVEGNEKGFTQCVTGRECAS